MFKHRVLWRICGPKRDDIPGSNRKLHTELLKHFSPSSDLKIINMIESSTKRWTRHVAIPADIRKAWKM
jgi:hypothetical protein